MINIANARGYSSGVQKINHPVHKGERNPSHGKFFIVGSIPLACYDKARSGGAGGSMIYDSEGQALDALIAAGAPNIQRADCSFAVRDGKPVGVAA